MQFIETREQLRTAYGETSELAARKVMPRLDSHARAFLAASPFCMIGSQDGAGRADVSPKGDGPGFVRALDDTTLALPDRPGNNRLDTWENVIANPAVGLIFMIPGVDDTLRINGTARLTTDEALCAELGMNGRPALAVLVIEVREVYLHCAKAFIRSHLWKPETWPRERPVPTLGEMVRDQLALPADGKEIDGAIEESYTKSMW